MSSFEQAHESAIHCMFPSRSIICPGCKYSPDPYLPRAVRQD
jgi:hypothetical protein